MSQPSDEVIILRQMLDIHEKSTRMLEQAGIEIDPKDKRELARLEKRLAKATGREEV